LLSLSVFFVWVKIGIFFLFKSSLFFNRCHRIYFDFSFFFPLLKEAKARAYISIRALYLLQSDFFNFNLFLAFKHSSSTIPRCKEYDENAYA